MDIACEDIEVVIVGAGICGLATALALHRKGVKSLVLERAESLRVDGAGIGILTNGWRALHRLGIASKLRQTAISIDGVRDVWFESGKQKLSPISRGEARCLRRSDLVKALADELPSGTIRFRCQVGSVNMDTSTSYPVLNLQDGSILKPKVLIGCDGANSVVAGFLELKPIKALPVYAVRGFTSSPNGHSFGNEVSRTRINQFLVGRIPVDDKLVFWFLLHQGYPNDANIAKDPELIREFTLKGMEGFPQEMVELVKNCDLNSLSLTHLRYRSPLEILTGKFRRGTVGVAGDAMHVMGPFLGQGGSAAIEDAIVLARCLAPCLKKVCSASAQSERDHNMKVHKALIEKALDEFVRERRMRLVRLTTQAYLAGWMLDPHSPMLLKFIIPVMLVVLFRDPTGHTRYDCGNL